MERIILIGCGGAGKSTLARQLGEKLHLPVVHLDKLFWFPGWQERTDGDFDALLDVELQKPQWIMDGNFNRTLPRRLEKSDTVIYLDYSRLTCLLGVAKRVLTTHGTVRPDMGQGCPERFDWEFLKWVWNFNKEKRKKFYEILASHPEQNIHIFRNRRQTKRFLDTL